MKQYTDLLRRILDTGRVKKNRTGTDVLSILGPQMEFDMDDGFPMVVERPIFFKGINGENRWFLKGLCNNEDLLAEGIKIWNQWALNEDVIRNNVRNIPEVVKDYVIYRQAQLPEGQCFSFEDAVKELTFADKEDMAKGLPVTGKELDAKSPDEVMGGHRLLREAGVLLTEESVTMPKGYLGPIYGVLWRGWIDHNGRQIDQVQNVIDKLISDNPKLRYSRANIVTAFNPGVLPDETLSAQENVLAGNQALAACHTMFQLFAEPMTTEERLAFALRTTPDKWQDTHNWFYRNSDGTLADVDVEKLDALLTENGIAIDQLSMKLYQRSADFAVGVPFNIAGYALLLHMFAKHTNMKPARFIHTFGDAHIYVDQLVGVHELLSRVTPTLSTIERISLHTAVDPHWHGAPAMSETSGSDDTTDQYNLSRFLAMDGPDWAATALELDALGVPTQRPALPALPTLWLNPEVASLYDYTAEDIKLLSYKPLYPQIKFAVAV